MFTSPPTQADILAAIDIGTNNCRLLIARLEPVLQPDGQTALKPEIIDAFSRLVRLGEGISTDPTLSEVAMQRTLEALSLCNSKMHRRGVTRYRAVATESCRRADNADEFLRRVKDMTGLEIEVIDATEEARLALQGCAPLFEAGYDRGLHFDIGGGSTELVWARLSPQTHGPLSSHLSQQAKIAAQISIPCGVAALTEVHGGDLVSDVAYKAMVDEVKSNLQPFIAQIADDFASAGRVQFLGCAGTISTIAALAQDLPFYQRIRVDGFHLDMRDARRIFSQLRKLNFRERAAMPVLGEERADLILAGCAIVETIADIWQVDAVRVADRGVREGILYDLAGIYRL